MKRILQTGLVALFLVGSISVVNAFEVDTLVDFSRGSADGGVTQQMAGRFYIPLMEDVDLLFGVGGYIPGNKSVTGANGSRNEFGVNGEIGVSVPVPGVGRHDISISITKDPVDGSDWMFAQNIFIRKNFLFPLTDQIKLGLTLNVATLNLTKNNRYATFFDRIFPVLGATIDLKD